ncbi:MAG: transcription-repair coupling factor [Polyangiaceae bacterium]|nr:transcription-repair coupling factor [Polyangiaceae bacterium]
MTDHGLLDDVASRFELPGDRPVLALEALVRRAAGQPGIHPVVHAEGCASALLATGFGRRRTGPILVVLPDPDAARRTAADLNALAAGLPLPPPHDQPLGAGEEPLLLLPSETTPYAEVHPDRRAAMTRASALFHIAAGLPWRFLVTTAAALVRRVAPPSVLAAAGVLIECDRELDLGDTVAKLVAAGYLRVPVVEDPGSLAARGGLLDVWPPGAAAPLRIELNGDLVAAMRCFHPDTQRTSANLERAWLAPAREAILTAEGVGRAQRLVRELCDQRNHPSTRARQLIEDVATGRPFFGAEAYLPAYTALVPLFTYFDPSTVAVVDDGVAVLRALRAELDAAFAEEARAREAPVFPRQALYVEEAEVDRFFAQRPTIVTHRTGVAAGVPTAPLEALAIVPVDAPSLATADHESLARAVKQSRSTLGRQATLEPLLRRLTAWHDRGLVVAITARTGTQAERVAALLRHHRVPVAVGTGVAVEDADDEDRDHLSVTGSGPRPPSGQARRYEAGAVRVVAAPLARGVVALGEGFVLVTEEEIFGQRAHRRAAPRRAARAVLEDLRALAPGDFVVHVEHGIGCYLGLERRKVGATALELIVVEYAGGDKLFLPVYRLNQIQKYAGGDRQPRLDRLGGQSFAKTKAKVQRRVRAMADDLLRLYAERAQVAKLPLPPADDDFATFEATFPFEETRDQALAIDEVMRDLTSTRVMDRLVCGDVGFGKTEVALRAAFRNVAAGRQVALLCPTTVLAQQHYNTFATRFTDYPFVVRALSRFQSRGEQHATLRGLKAGSVDVVIGTHRLLSKDVHYRNLGLLVIDEEQRFGVAHKERIKQLRASVDALTLSATPIPRTLQMAVGGLRDMSLITTPPVDRRAIRTVITRFEDQVVQEAVQRELYRGGQVFYVYGRIEGLYDRAERLQALVPEARIAVVHGKLSEHTLEQAMVDFVGGQYDVLVATAIIESGIDIPRANTILVDRADLFGLAQLYQLRGRVGRSSERAYCYLLVPPPTQMTDDARSRLEALERHTELGSGFTIATLDLELRGAGELLGAEQSGVTATVGFELFCQMLEEATRELRGESVVPEVEPELSFDVEALIPEDYVAEVGVRLSIYKRLASAIDEAEVAEIGAEMEDRFGQAPREVQRLVEMMRVKTELRRLRVLGIEATARNVHLFLRDDTPLDPQRIGRLLARRGSPYRLSPDGRLTRRFSDSEAPPDGIGAADAMLQELAGFVGETPVPLP